ncbi:hypothetical protein KAU33_02420 [Candidatus Dependentiae bacterium]|nr:hypothetical protein [Candidatus Dependentiae bacterium]
MLDNLFKSLKKEERVTERAIKKNGRSVNKAIKPYEKDPRRYTKKQRIAIVAASMLIIGLYTKYINFGHWVRIGFDMSSYPPESAIFWLAGSTFAFLYGYYLENKFLETLALIGLGFALIFTAGIVNTYVWAWVWWV